MELETITLSEEVQSQNDYFSKFSLYVNARFQALDMIFKIQFTAIFFHVNFKGKWLVFLTYVI